jgi:hypothetical protein
MKKPEENDDLQEEYDFKAMKGGVRGKYFQQVAAGSNLVLLDPDVAKAFPTQEAVNKALRMLAEIAKEASAELTTSSQQVSE